MSIWVSFSMYFLSFVPLWLTVLFIDLKSIFDGDGNIWSEILGITGIFLGLLFSVLVLLVMVYKTDGKKETYTLLKAKESKTITAEFLLSYILPLFAFDFTKWDEMVKFLIFFLIFGYLCVRHNYFSVNIVLEFMHYRMYDCCLLTPDGTEVDRIVISKSALSTNKGKEIHAKIINNEYCLDVNGRATS